MFLSVNLVDVNQEYNAHVHTSVMVTLQPKPFIKG